MNLYLLAFHFFPISSTSLFRSRGHYNFYLFVSVSPRKYEFALEEVEGFRYRSRDAWRAVTRIAVREARLKEIKQELLNCKKLQVRISSLL